MAEVEGGLHVWVRAGRLHIAAEVYAHLMQGCPAVALQVRDGQWIVLPLLAGAGGLQVKIRNARGDRVVEAQEFFRNQGLDDDQQREFDLKFEPELGGYSLRPLG